MPDAYPLERPRQAGCAAVLGWVLALATLSALLLLIVTWRMGVEVTRDATRMAESVATEFNRVFNFTPEIRVDSVVVVASSTPVLELVTVQKQSLIRHQWNHTWLHSTKTLQLEATFTAKAGFDLTEPFRVQIDPRLNTIGAEMPKPKILTLSMSDLRILQDEDGYWNRLTSADREAAIKELEKQARTQFSRTAILAEARNEAEKRIRELLQRGGALSFITPSPSPKP